MRTSRAGRSATHTAWPAAACGCLQVKLLQDLGVDAAFDYHKEAVSDAIPKLCEGGIDIDYEQVGGAPACACTTAHPCPVAMPPVHLHQSLLVCASHLQVISICWGLPLGCAAGENLEVCLEHMNKHGRVVLCGMVSQYNLPPAERYGIKNLFHATGKQASVQQQGAAVTPTVILACPPRPRGAATCSGGGRGQQTHVVATQLRWHVLWVAACLQLLMQGFIVSDLAKGMHAEFMRDMVQWVSCLRQPSSVMP